MNVSSISLRDLGYVVAVADERHFGRAAERCNVSQPALSAQIRKLEDTIALVLFERTSRRVLPTASGESFIGQARVVLEEARKLLTIASQSSPATLAGRLSLAAIPTLGPYLFPKVLRTLRTTYPDLMLNLSEGRTAELLDGLKAGRLDAVLLSLPIDETGLTAVPLFSEPFLLACPPDHPLAGREPLAPIDLAGPDLLLLDEGNCLRDQTLDACQIAYGAGRHATSLETLRSMVSAGAGYMLLPRLAVRDRDGEDLIVCRTFTTGDPGRVVALAWRARDPRVDSFRDLARFFRVHAPDGTEPATAPFDALPGPVAAPGEPEPAAPAHEPERATPVGGPGPAGAIAVRVHS